MTKLWYNWLVAWCCYIGFFGLVLAGATFEATDAPARLAINLLGGAGYELTDHLRFGIGIQGALSLALAIIIYGIAKSHRQSPVDNRVWQGVLCALAVWFVVDGITSYATGFYLNIASNAFILITLWLPLFKSNLLKPSQ